MRAANIEPIKSIESEIARAKAIKHEMDVLAAEYERIKKYLIETHFAHNEEFVGSEGLVLATYKSQLRVSLDSAKLKKEQADIFDQYSKIQEVKTFLIKK